jgi:hypothetical protein
VNSWGKAYNSRSSPVRYVQLAVDDSGAPACNWRPRIARAIQPDYGPIADVHSVSIPFGQIRQVKPGLLTPSREVEWLSTRTGATCNNLKTLRLTVTTAQEQRLLSPGFTGVWVVTARLALRQDTSCPRRGIIRIQQLKDRSAGASSSTPITIRSEHRYEAKSCERRSVIVPVCYLRQLEAAPHAMHGIALFRTAQVSIDLGRIR